MRRFLGWGLSIPTCFLLLLVSQLVSCDADWASVREFLRKDYSSIAGDPVGKYFRPFSQASCRLFAHQFTDESSFDRHYDGRFSSKPLPDEERLSNLAALMKSYLATMQDLGAETWLMHGTLIGWWWNRKILPWDTDIDVQMTFDSISFLHSYYQLYVFHYSHPDFPNGRDYMLEINENFDKADERNLLNAIDARWIDIDTGVFIDITAVRPDEERRAKGESGALICKDLHRYDETDIFPLRDSIFEGVHVKIPYEYISLLEEEYSRRALVENAFEGHKFDSKLMKWEPIELVSPIYSVFVTTAHGFRGKSQQFPKSRKGQPGRHMTDNF